MPSFDLASLLQDSQVSALLSVFIAGVVGGLAGLERELTGKPAGVRTYALICMGAAIFTSGATQAWGTGDSAARVAAQIVTGIGFLGAGTIIHTRNRVVGLTTAASIWVVAGIGMVLGAGLYILGIGSAVLVLLLLRFLRTGWIDQRAATHDPDVTDVTDPTDDDPPSA